MNLQQLFGKWFAFLRDNLTARGTTIATKSDTVDDPAGEGWIMTLVDATVVALPSGNSEGDTITLPLLALQVLPIKFRRVYSTGTDAVTVYILNNGN